MDVIKVIRWIARISGLLLALFMVLVVLTVLKGGKSNGVNLADLIDLIFFTGLFAGLVLLWPKEVLGIILCYAGLLGFILHIIYSDGPNSGWYKPLYLAIPPTLMVFCRMAQKENKDVR